MIEGRLEHSDVACAERAPRCLCLFQLWKGPPFVAGKPTPESQCIAACPTYEAHNAARRLLGDK